MSLDRTLLLSFALTAVACGDSGTASVTDASSSGTTGTTDDEPTTQSPTSTGTPTTTTDDTTTNGVTTTQGPTTDTPDTSTGDTTGPATESTSTGPADTTDTTDGTTTGTTGDTTTGDTTDTTTGDTTDTTTGDTTTGTTGDTTTGTTGDTTTGTTGDTSTGDTTTGTTGTTGDTDTMGGVEAEIYDIQDGTILAGTAVDVQGVIVTGISATLTGLFVQEPTGGQESGVWVFVGKMGPDIGSLAIGDEVDVIGVTQEFNELTEINASMGSVVATGVQGLVVDPELLPIETFADPALAEPWEGVHVGVIGAPLSLSAVQGGVEYTLTELGDNIVIDDLLYASFMDQVAFPGIGVGATFTGAFGPLNQSGPAYKIAPRSADDLEGYMAPNNPVVGVNALPAGALVISEVMYNPTCNQDNCEWIEVYNASASSVDLQGLVIQDDAQNANAQGIINQSVIVAPGSFTVLGYKTIATWPYPNPPAAFYGANPALGNGANSDRVYLKNSTITLDAMPKWPSKNGMDAGYSFKVAPDKLNAVDNDVLANWCYSTVVFYTDPMNVTEKGSPAAANEAACAPI